MDTCNVPWVVQFEPEEERLVPRREFNLTLELRFDLCKELYVDYNLI
jgi:hypothetical protein